MAGKSYPRSRRVAQQIQRALSELIRREVKDPRLGMVTLTDVRVSNDLSHAKVYYSVLAAGEGPTPAERERTQSILDSAAEMLRGPLGRACGLRLAPHLQFLPDELIEGGARLSALISQAVRDDQARRGVNGGEAKEPAGADPAQDSEDPASRDPES